MEAPVTCTTLIALQLQERKKSCQSKFKCAYGLPIRRAVDDARNYLQQKNQKGWKVIFLILEIELAIFAEKLKSLEEYVENYFNRSQKEMNNKGKKVSFHYFKKDVENGLIVIDLVITFLNEKNPSFQHYLSTNPDQKKNIAEVLTNKKDLATLAKKFVEMKGVIQEMAKQA